MRLGAPLRLRPPSAHARAFSRSARAAAAARPPLTIGIRREDPARLWERRCPLTPDAVAHLVRDLGVRVHVQPCERRVFNINQFIAAGAEPAETMDAAHIIVGIKETPLAELVTAPAATPRTMPADAPAHVARTHLMFSHTAKAQPYNMPLLSRFLAGHPGAQAHESHLLPRLIDFEFITHNDRRTVGFGWFAGVAGVFESLSAMAHSHLEIGIASPFLYTPRPHSLPTLDALRASLRRIGESVAQEGTPRVLGPFVIGLTGNGNVSQGCLSALSELPLVHVKVEDLPALVNNPDTDLHKIYLVHALPQDYLTSTKGVPYSREDYHRAPDTYVSNFAEKVAPYLTLFLNGVGWTPAYPRLMTNDQLATALERAHAIGGARFTNIGDISCDVEGGLEFLPHASTISAPFYKTRPAGLPAHLPPVQVMAVDILPAAVPRDASAAFSSALLPYVEALVGAYGAGGGAGGAAGAALARATIAEGGRLVPAHASLGDAVGAWRATADTLEAPAAPAAPAVPAAPPANGTLQGAGPRKKRVLLLGSGMVAGPAVAEIARRADVALCVAGNSAAELDALRRAHPSIVTRAVDLGSEADVRALVAAADVVISLLPVGFHPRVAEWCVSERTHLVTASYIAPAMRALDSRARAADVLLLNEIGLDPGLDHCSAVALVARLRAAGEQVVSFASFCGGLPAPECADGPLRYKFSWSPRGVLLAALSGARYKAHGAVVEVAGRDLLRAPFADLPILPGVRLEGVANRDSLPYAEAYGLGAVADLRTLLRGTLRYPGFAALMDAFKTLGLLAADTAIALPDWASLAPLAARAAHGPAARVADVVAAEQLPAVTAALAWLVAPGGAGLPALPRAAAAPLDLFSALLAHRLRYGRGERDMVVLAHEVVTRRRGDAAGAGAGAGAGAETVHTATLVAHGGAGASAMARTVGLPVALAALEVLAGRVGERGVVGPTVASVYGPVLAGLARAGLGMVERSRAVRAGEATVEACLARRA